MYCSNQNNKERLSASSSQSSLETLLKSNTTTTNMYSRSTTQIKTVSPDYPDDKSINNRLNIQKSGYKNSFLGSPSQSEENSSDGGSTSSRVLSRFGKQQDPFLLVDPDLTIPTLLDLTQQDYEVNAPASNASLLQGEDLLMALDQTTTV